MEQKSMNESVTTRWTWDRGNLIPIVSVIGQDGLELDPEEEEHKQDHA